MAGVVRLQGLQRLRKTFTVIKTSRGINSSTKKCEAKTQTGWSPAPKDNWVSYGFDHKNKKNDRDVAAQTFFVTVTVCIVFGGTVFSFLPDPLYKDWAQREGYLELRRREELGLPLIDPNLIDPAKVVLPTDEELGDMEIII